MSDDERYRPYKFAGGRIYLDVEESLTMRRRAEGTYEPFKVAALQQLLPAGGTVVDVGSNKGDFALIAARSMGPEGRVIAIEPEPENCRWIQRSVDLNEYTNVELHQLALSDVDGEAPLYLGETSGRHALRPGREEQESIMVRTRTLDSLLEDLGTGPPDMLKIDVEGAEVQVLAGAARTLMGSAPMWVLLDVHPNGGVDPQAVADTLRAHGFELRRPDHPAEAIAEITPRTKELFALRG